MVAQANTFPGTVTKLPRRTPNGIAEMAATERVGSLTRQEWIPLNKIIAHPGYQREYRQHWAKQIAKRFDARKWTNPEVARRSDGRYVAIDGQHRFGALRIIHGENSGILVLCDVLDDLTEAQEAEIFSSRNTDVQKATSVDRIPARLAMGEVRAVTLKEIIERHGFRLRMSSGSKIKSGEISIASLEKILNSAGQENYQLIAQTISMLQRAYGSEEAIPTGMVIALGSFVATYQDHKLFDERWMVKRLAETSPTKFSRDNEALRKMIKTSEGISGKRLMLEVYNHGKQQHTRLPEA